MSLETFVANEFNDIFSGRQLRQDVKLAPKLMNHESSIWVLPNHQQTLKMGKELVPKLSTKLHILTLLSAREKFC